MQTVTCAGCGASTPVPTDLQQPTFPCAACGLELRTAEIVGAVVTSADAFLHGLRRAITEGSTEPLVAPMEGRPAEARPGTCLRCKGPIEVPMALRVHHLTCPACGCVQPVAAHVSDAERLRIDMELQIAANERLKALRAEGVACPRCAGHNEVPPTGVQVTCRFCGAAVLLAAVVGEDAVARERLGKGVRAAIDEARQQQEQRQRRVNFVILAVVGAAVLLGVGGLVLSSLLGAIVAALR